MGRCMYKKSIISLTNKVSIVVVFLLLYWVFIFSVSMVFGFKVFKENLTETFFFMLYFTDNQRYGKIGS